MASKFTYDKFKTPFTEVRIGDSTGKRMVVLPDQIKRLLDKVEILETNNIGNECLVAQQIILSFVEGSREPFDIDSNPKTGSVYPLGTNAGDNLSNKSGFLPDLTFTHEGGELGFTSLESVTATPQIRDAAGLLEKFSQGKITDSSVASPTGSQVHYLFQEGNQVSVTWGYIQDKGPPLKRTVRARVQLVESDFPENGPIRITVNCLCPTADADKIAPVKGFNFSKEIPYGFDPISNNITVVHEDKDITSVLNDIADETGMNVIIDTNKFPADKIQKHNSRIWVGGDSFHQFMLKEASRMSAYYTVVLHPKTGEETIVFIPKEVLDAIPLLDDKSLFVYKGPGSLLRSIKVKVDFAHVTGNARVGVNAAGEVVGTATNSGAKIEVFDKNQKKVDSQPKSPQMTALKDKAGSTKAAIGKTEYHPEATDKDKMKQITESTASCQNKGLVSLDFVSIGYPKLAVPGTIYFGGIGLRYTGFYKVLTLTHTLDSSGYVCKGTANSQAIQGQVGVKPTEKTPIQDKATDVELFQSASLPASQVTGQVASLSPIGGSSDTRKEYLDLIYS